MKRFSKKTEYGIFTDIPNEKYHSEIPAISKGDLDKINRSPFMFMEQVAGLYKQEETPAMQFGSLVHTALLEPDKLIKNYASDELFLELGGRTSKAYKDAVKEYLDTNKGISLVKADDWASLQKIMQEAKSNELISELLTDGVAEQTIVWKEEGLNFRCRPDYMREWAGKTLAIDIKTTKNIKEFERTIANFRYHVQAAHYMAGLTEVMKKECLFVFIILENQYPFASRIVALNDMTLKLGSDTRQKDIDTLKECIKSNTFPKYERFATPEIEVVDVPAWAFYNTEFNR